MSIVQVLVLAVLQGFSELFPVSSLGHSVILPRLLGWHIDQHGPTFLPFLVVLHLGTAGALLVFFWRDWLAIVLAFFRSAIRGKLSGDPKEHLAWMLVVGTIPAALIGLFLEKPLRSLFGSPMVAAIFLILNGLMMLGGEWLRRRQEPGASGGILFKHESGRDLDSLTWRSAAGIGIAQSAALIPGFSRSGTTMVAGLSAKFRHEPAARFSFLLATPIILGAGLVEVPTLFLAANQPMLGPAILGGVVAGITAFLSVKFLMRYFQFGRLDPFAYYCLGAGILSLAIFLLR
ncbi:MAG: undecaprenyl-diphosphate phosphatase [Chloroflexota bacterium]